MSLINEAKVFGESASSALEITNSFERVNTECILGSNHSSSMARLNYIHSSDFDLSTARRRVKKKKKQEQTQQSTLHTVLDGAPCPLDKACN